MTYEEVVNAWRDKSYTPKDYSSVLRKFGVLLTYNSCKIENPEIRSYDVYHDVTDDMTDKLFYYRRTLLEIRNARTTFYAMCDALKDKRPLNEELVLELHEELTYNTYDSIRVKKGEWPGEYKHGEYAVLLEDGTETGASAEDAREELLELLDETADIISNKDRLSIKNLGTAAAYFHGKFESIHPFADGNGRIGRLMMNYMLLSMNCPPVVVFAENNTAKYYSALTAFSKELDLKPLSDFIRQQTVLTWKEI